MAESIVSSNKRPRAIAKEKDGIVLYWVEELNEGGLHLKGLARLLDYDENNLRKFVKGGVDISVLEAEIPTPGGVQGVYLYLGSDVAKILRAISRSKMSQAVRDRADDIRDSLVAAGFKLAVMLELAPHKLKEQVDQHVTEADKLIELERLRLRVRELDNAALETHSSALVMHGSAWLALQGVAVDLTVTIQATEVVEPATGRSTQILSADQLKRAVKERTGQNLKTMSEFTSAIKAAGRDDLLIPVTRHNTSEYVIPDKLDKAIAIVYKPKQQRLIGQ
jgi:hypothetical protein